MSLAVPANATDRRSIGPVTRDLFAALVCVALYGLLRVASSLAIGFQPPADNDSMLRLVMVRDLLNGQSWFDPWLYRMGLEGGFPMHWSRLIDLPIALVIGLGNVLTGNGEAFAAHVYPYSVMALALFALLRGARAYGSETAILPAAIIGTITLFHLGIFNAGFFDHHNVQVALVLFLLLAFLHERRPLRRGLAAGGLSAAMLAIGMETVHFVAFAGIGAYVTLLLEREPGRRFALGFGTGFAGFALVAFVATIGPDRYAVAACDAFSVVHLVLAMVAGTGLAAIALLSGATGGGWKVPLGAGAVLAIVLGGLVVTAFPQCLQAPYADLDPRLHTYWLDYVLEARPLTSFLSHDPILVGSRLVTPLLALAVVAWRTGKGVSTHKSFVLAAFLATSIVVGFWQVRGTLFSVAIAAIPLASLVSIMRERAAEAAGGTAETLKMVAAWIISANMVWGVAFGQVAALAKSGSGEAEKPKVSAEDVAATCLSADILSPLAGQPPATVLAVSNLGSAILLHTHQRVLAGPYHRNIDGNLAEIAAFTEPPEQAHAVIRDSGATLFAHCPGNPETRVLAAKAPDGLLARVMAGDVPDWLVPLTPDAGAPLQVYRIR
ncbi:MAG: GtrA family protein [Brucellaceae bacterium]|nr:GtrA family protein [Brucellaceae bacterium]